MDVRGLRYFTTIADYGSFSAASRRLRIAQPALSRQVRLLEEELGSELLARTTSGVALTEAGQRLYRHAQSLLYQFGQTREIVQGNAQEVAGQVTIGLPTTICAILAKPFLHEALQRYPNVRIRLVESLGSVLKEMLDRGSLDLAVLYNAKSAPGSSVAELVVEDLCLIGAADQIPDGLNSIEFRQLADFPLILPSMAQSVRRLLESMALSEGFDLRMRLEVDSIALTKQVAEMGLAFAIASYGVVHQEVLQGSLRTIKIVNTTKPRSVTIARATDAQSLASKHMHDLIREICEGLVLSGQWRSSRINATGAADADVGLGRAKD